MKKNIILGFFFLLLAFAIVGIVINGKIKTGGDRADVSAISGSTIVDIEGERLLVDKEKSLFEFEGYALAGTKSHVGTFDEWTGNLIIENDEIVGFEGTINPASVNTGIERLDSDLKSDNFFDVEKFGEIKFISDNIDLENRTLSGQLTFRGVVKEISFPIEISENGNEISGEFFLDVTPFGFKYTGITDEVRIKFNFLADEE